MNCRQCKPELPTLLLDPANPAAAAAQAHVAACDACASELHSMRSTMALMDAWTAPEPSPFFDTRLRARLREEFSSAPAGLWERLRARLLFGSTLRLRPAFSAAAVLVLLAGGGFAGFNILHPRPAEVSATVQELQTLDRNEQAINQMDQLIDEGNDNSADQGNTQQNP